MTVKRDGKRFFLEVFNPVHEWRCIGKVVTFVSSREVDCFVTHVKVPGKHFYVKGLGYPINKELLVMLRNAKVDFILIPEEGKRGFRVFLAETEQYLSGEEISEPLTECQLVVPLAELSPLVSDEVLLRKVIA
jgi:hypothetical protein